MQVQFNIHFKTQWGESICLLLHPNDSKSDTPEQFFMQCNETSEWILELELNQTDSISYQYSIYKTDKTHIFEYGGVRKLHFAGFNNQKVIVNDNWRASYGDSPFITAAFTDCFFKREIPKTEGSSSDGNLILQLNCPQLEPDRHFAIIGNQAELGNWDVNKKNRLDEKNFPICSVTLNPVPLLL